MDFKLFLLEYFFILYLFVLSKKISTFKIQIKLFTVKNTSNDLKKEKRDFILIIHYYFKQV